MFVQRHHGSIYPQVGQQATAVTRILGSHPVDVRRAVYRSRLPRIDIITLGGFSVLKDRRIPTFLKSFRSEHV